MSLSPYLLHLQTGWFTIQVDCHETEAWFPVLRERYAEFLVPAHTGPVSPAIQITLRIPDTSSDPSGHKVFHFSPPGGFFSAPGWEGVLDFSSGTGWVRPASAYYVEELDYFLRVACALQAFRTGGLLFHAAGIVRDAKAYVFFGHSGAGKTTVSRLSGVDHVLNDDLLLLRPEAAGWQVYSTPFFNPTQVPPRENRSATLTSMFSLVQDQEVYLETPSQAQLLAELVANIPVVSTDPRATLPLIARCQTLLSHVPVYRLHFRKDDSFWACIEQEETTQRLSR
jgi:hypothetical protein